MGNYQLGFDENSSKPVFDQYQKLKRDGVTDQDIDVGYRVPNYSHRHCGETSEACLKGAGDKYISPEEVVDYSIAHPTEQTNVISYFTIKSVGKDGSLGEKLLAHIHRISEELIKSGIEKDSNEFKIKLAKALSVLMSLPRNPFSQWTKNEKGTYVKVLDRLSSLGLSAYEGYLKDHGGLRPDVLSPIGDLNADVAYQKNEGNTCTPSIMLRDALDLAGIKSDFAMVDIWSSDEPHIVVARIVAPTASHFCISVLIDGKRILLDPTSGSINPQHKDVYIFPDRSFYVFAKMSVAAQLLLARQMSSPTQNIDDEIKDTIDLYVNASLIDTENPYAGSMRGIAEASLSNDKIQAAFKYINRAIDTFPDNPQLYFQRALLHSMQENYRAQSDDLSQAIAILEKKAPGIYYLQALYSLRANAESRLDSTGPRTLEAYNDVVGFVPSPQQVKFAKVLMPNYQTLKKSSDEVKGRAHYQIAYIYSFTRKDEERFALVERELTAGIKLYMEPRFFEVCKTVLATVAPFPEGNARVELMADFYRVTRVGSVVMPLLASKPAGMSPDEFIDALYMGRVMWNAGRQREALQYAGQYLRNISRLEQISLKLRRFVFSNVASILPSEMRRQDEFQSIMQAINDIPTAR